MEIQVCKCPAEDPRGLLRQLPRRPIARCFHLFCCFCWSRAKEPRHQQPRSSSTSSEHPAVTSPTHVFATKHQQAPHTTSSNLGAATARWSRYMQIDTEPTVPMHEYTRASSTAILPASGPGIWHPAPPTSGPSTLISRVNGAGTRLPSKPTREPRNKQPRRMLCFPQYGVHFDISRGPPMTMAVAPARHRQSPQTRQVSCPECWPDG